MTHIESGEDRTQSSAPAAQDIFAPDGSYTRSLTTHPWDLEIKPQSIAGHGLTGRWAWAIRYQNEHHTRIRYGDSATRERAFFDLGYAVGQLL